MDLKGCFRLSWKKVIVSVVLVVIFVIILNYLTPKIMCKCVANGFENCKDYYNFFVVKSGCHCGCWDGIDLILHYIRVILIPFIVAYVVCSLISLFWRKRRK